MTRGMKGCYVYFMDKALEEFFGSHIDRFSAEDPVRMVAESSPIYRDGGESGGSA